jgi:hypothetical protein
MDHMLYIFAVLTVAVKIYFTAYLIAYISHVSPFRITSKLLETQEQQIAFFVYAMSMRGTS